nr:glycosyltransferase family 1 protein [Variovorax boronicumulans]
MQETPDRQAGGTPAWEQPLALRSFWMGGFEGADHLDPQRRPLDMASAHGHLSQLEDDYARAAAAGLRTVRESIGWRLCEPRPGVFDLARPLRMARCARRHGLQILWTVMHYGTPPDVDLRDDALIDRFAAFAAVVAQALGGQGAEPPIYTLVNEISFLSWAVAHTNMLGAYQGAEGRRPSTRASGYEVKRRLVRATLAATEAVRRIDPQARFLQVEPLVHVVAPAGRPELAPLAAQVAGYQWQAWDLLAGRAEPGLGGGPGMLDLLGVNHYHSGQWEVETEERLWWHVRDPRRRGLDALLQDAWQRYGRPLLVAETSHVGAGRAAWLSDVACQAARARAAGVPLLGLCLYPLVDRPDWNDASAWHHSGLWDVAPAPAARTPFERVLHRPYARALALWQQRLPEPAAAPEPPTLAVFSHRPWDLLQHRTLHLMTALAADHRIVVVEPPVAGDGPARLLRSCPWPGVEVLQPLLPGTAGGFDGAPPHALAALLAPALPSGALAWACTPLCLPLLRALRLRPAVYDCAEGPPLGAAEPRWRLQQARLLRKAAQVCAAGPALARALARQRPGVESLFQAVDAAHFAPAAVASGGSEAQEAARLLGGLVGPVLCHVGRIGTHVDLALLAAIADARPHWQLVLIGPVALPADTPLPQRPNLHWLGAQPYSLLPALLARVQLGLLAWHRDAHTELAHPPQLLEFLAAGKPVVSVPLPDVHDLYAAVVDTAEDAAGFVRACEAALQRQGVHDLHRHARIQAMLARCSWEGRAQTVRALLHPAAACATN